MVSIIYHLNFWYVVMVGDGPRRELMWKDLVRNIRNILSKWKRRFLSLGGRVVLINYVINLIPIYTMSFYKALVKVITEIQSIQSKFLWRVNENKG